MTVLPAALAQKLQAVREAQKKYAAYSQQQVDEIFRQAAIAANNARIELARLAVEETGMGILEDKVIKNHFASEYIYNRYKDEKTCGVIERDEAFGVELVAEPVGIIAAIIPTTNPTSTTIFKSLIALKTRNGVVFSPHPRAKGCTIAAAKIMLNAAIQAGAPQGIIAWIDEPTTELSQLLMRQADMILATGGPSLVRAAYSSGKPAIGVGPGNTPAIIDETADIKMAVSSILLSKTFDNGLICASEQAVIAMGKVYGEVRREFEKRGAYILSAEEADRLRKVMVSGGAINTEIIGQSACRIAGMAGIDVPASVRALIAEVESTDPSEPFSREKLAPVLAMYSARTFDEALEKASRLIESGGFGHTSALYADRLLARERIERFAAAMKTGRTIINMPSSHGAIGDIYNFRLTPSLTLGCGTWGGNSVTDNVGVRHLLNIKTVAERRENMLWFRVPEKIYFKFGCLGTALRELKQLGRTRAFIVTDRPLYRLGVVDSVIRFLDEMGMEHSVFFDVEPDPTLAVARKGAAEMAAFRPDVILAVGGGSPMDAAKIMWVLYEHPEVRFEDLSMRFMDIRKRVYRFPKMGEKAMLVCIPTTAGTGSEISPFTVITDERTGVKYPLADYELTPDMAIIDAQLMLDLPRELTAASGFDALTHAIEAYVSVMASELTDGLALEAIRLIFRYLPQAYSGGPASVEAREKMAHASAVAGMAFANAFLGLCHSMAHKLGSMHHVAHGVANAVLIGEVIRFNAVDDPRKQAAFPQYRYPNAKQRYAQIADCLGLHGSSDDEKVQRLLDAIDGLKKALRLPMTIAEAGVPSERFYATLDEMSLSAFDDQCTPTNPRYPLVCEIKQMYTNAYEGTFGMARALCDELLCT